MCISVAEGANVGIHRAIVELELSSVDHAAARVVERNAVLADVGYLRVSGVASLETAGTGYRSPRGRQRLRLQQPALWDAG